ncbi:hypothetical protein FZEAL_2255, partial [Fusarium zealandicum]
MSTSRSGHLERTAQEPRDQGLHVVRLDRIDQVNERIRLFRLTLESGPVEFSAGQWLDTYVPNTAKPGGFTITSRPSAAASTSQRPYLELAVQESPENPPAAWLWRSPSEILGSKLQVRVGGSFVFPPRHVCPDEMRRVVFVAGGVGINPLVSMMGCIAEGGHDVDVRVLYASKVPPSGLSGVLFLDRIRGWFDEGRLRGELKVFATRRGEGRFGVEHAKEAVGGDEAVVYVCG